MSNPAQNLMYKAADILGMSLKMEVGCVYGEADVDLDLGEVTLTGMFAQVVSSYHRKGDHLVLLVAFDGDMLWCLRVEDSHKPNVGLWVLDGAEKTDKDPNYFEALFETAGDGLTWKDLADLLPEPRYRYVLDASKWVSEK